MEQASLLLLESPFPKVVMKPLHWKEDNMERKAKGVYAILDRDTGKVFSTVSKDYRLIRHEEAIAEVESAIGRSMNLGPYMISTDFYNDGARMRRTYRFPETSVNVAPDDDVNLTLDLYNSYDLVWPFKVILGGFRLVCSNGMVIGKNYYRFEKRHIFDLADVAMLDDLSTSIKGLKAQSKKWKQWANTRLTPRVYDAVMKTMKLGVKAVGEIEEEAKRTTLDEGSVLNISLWEFYNLLTWHITHRAVSLNHAVEMEDRMRVAMKYFRV